MRLTALQNLKFGGKVFKRGETFEAADKYARTLVALRQAQAAKAEPARRAPSPPPADDDKPARKEKEKYSTRRMRAKD